MTDSLTLDLFFLKETLKLAKKGRSWTNPNPLVGAVIVRNGKIIGRGYHHKVGLPHAEIEALKNAKTDVKGATLYVNLEPCVHRGRTPPCVNSLIKAGLRRVVCATLDPNPQVQGKGVALLRKSGIAVATNLLPKEARELNEAFFAFHENSRPLIALKFAQSLDGKLATRTGDSQWITNSRAREFARRLRSRYQAILVGVNTVIRDDPHLGVRTKSRKDPLRIILDSTLRIPLEARVLRDRNVLIFTTLKADKDKKLFLEKKGINLETLDGDTIEIKKMLAVLTKHGIISVLVEGGGKILGSFVDARLFDKVYAFSSPIVIGGEGAVVLGGEGVKHVDEALRLTDLSYKKFGDNLVLTGSFQNAS